MPDTPTPQKLVHLIDVIRPGGGPSGYLYNLHHAIGIFGDVNFSVRYDARSVDRDNSPLLKLKWPDFLARHLKPWKFMAHLLLGQKFESETEACKPYAVVMVHMAPHAARLLRIKHPSAKLVFMPHAPTSFTDEVIGEISLRHGRSAIFGLYRWILEKLERKIMSSADLMVVAALEGVESYFDGRGIPAHHVYEVISGVSGFATSIGRDQARHQLGLPLGKVIVGYFGRYNHDKGFDFLQQEIAAMAQDDSVLFISAGAGALVPITSPNYQNFGWRSDVDVLITACDVVVTPNKHTYFDLLPLEALSLSRPVLASRVGGNKKLARLSNAVTLFDRKPGALVDAVKTYAEMSSAKRNALEVFARASYDSHFSQQAFWQAHRDLAAQILQHFSRGGRGKNS